MKLAIPLLSALSLLACDKPGATKVETSAPVVDAAIHKPDAALATPAPKPPPPPPPRMHVVALHGRPLADCTLAREMDLAPGCTVSLAAGDALTLSLEDHVRVSITGPALARLLPESQPALLLHDGLLTLDIAPRGKRGGASAFWLATPTSRLEIPDNARVALRTFDNLATAISVVSGFVSVRELEPLFAMPAGSSLCAGSGQQKLKSLRVTTLALAEAELAKAARSCAPARAPEDNTLALALAAANTAIQAAAQHERELLSSHGRLVISDAGAAADTRLELAHLGAELLLLRDRQQALGQQFSARTLVVPVVGP